MMKPLKQSIVGPKSGLHKPGEGESVAALEEQVLQRSYCPSEQMSKRRLDSEDETGRIVIESTLSLMEAST